MFVSADFLAIQYGVDDKIARFFVDREPPINNLYWKDKLLYLRFEPGYVFIPLIVDLICKTGVSRDQLLSRPFIELMEAIGHVSALEETRKITNEEAIARCTALATPVCKCEAYLSSLMNLFAGQPSEFTDYKTPFNALHRGDLFLFAVCALETSMETYQRIVQLWFALISSLLLLDDAEDVKSDHENNEPNALLESGMDDEGLQRLKDLVQKNLQLIASVNRTMANKIDKQLVDMFNKPYFQQLYNHN